MAAMNVPSDNFIAETLIKALGATFGGAGRRARGRGGALRTVPSSACARRAVDGSGLSRSNRTSPQAVVSLLTAMDEGALSEPFAALAAGRRAHRDAARPDAGDRRPRRLPRQDRHALQRVGAGRLLRHARRRPGGVRVPHERRVPVEAPAGCRTGWRRAGALQRLAAPAEGCVRDYRHLRRCSRAAALAAAARRRRRPPTPATPS